MPSPNARQQIAQQLEEQEVAASLASKSNNNAQLLDAALYQSGRPSVRGDIQKSLVGLPQNIQDLYKKGDIAGFNQALTAYNAQQTADFEANVLPTLPANLQAIYKSGNTAAFNTAITAGETVADATQAAAAAAGA